MALERERERESRNLVKVEERKGLYSLNRPLFICTTKLTQGRSVNDNARNISEMQNNRKSNSMKNILNAVSGITLIALVVTIVVLLILAGVTITVVFGDNGILQLAKEAGEKTNEAVKKDQDQISDAEGIINEYLTELNSPIKSSIADEKVTFKTNYGTIDVIWLDTNNRVKSLPNEPILSAKNDSGIEETMTKVKWTYNEETKTWGDDEVPSSNVDWYNYQKAEGTDDTRNSRWANAKTANGSYFVWIPRYAYRITYYASEENIEEQEPTGYYDGWGMYDKEGNLKYKLDEGIETVAYNGNKYIVHPAFMDNRENNFDNGGWDKDLAGFWFAKYEMSGDRETVESVKNELKSMPTASSLMNINVGQMYQISRNATYGYQGKEETLKSGNVDYTHTSYMNSHMVKNSEWGAVAYLAHSSYGRNGHKVEQNNYMSDDLDIKTGIGSLSGTMQKTTSTENAYNTLIGTGASTTGNIYGIYDMNGGAFEFVASFDKKGDAITYGSELVKEAKSTTQKNETETDYEYISTKYVTTYINGTTDTKLFHDVGKIGDAGKEVVWYNTNGDKIPNLGEVPFCGWFNVYQNVVSYTNPFYVRGGRSEQVGTGIFEATTSSGSWMVVDGFRTALCP